MDSFELNKIIAAVLLIALIVIGIGKVSDIAFKVDKPEKSATIPSLSFSDFSKNFDIDESAIYFTILNNLSSFASGKPFPSVLDVIKYRYPSGPTATSLILPIPLSMLV